MAEGGSGSLLPAPAQAVEMKVFHGGGSPTDGGAVMSILPEPVKDIPMNVFKGGGEEEILQFLEKNYDRSSVRFRGLTLDELVEVVPAISSYDDKPVLPILLVSTTGEASDVAQYEFKNKYIYSVSVFRQEGKFKYIRKGLGQLLILENLFLYDANDGKKLQHENDSNYQGDYHIFVFRGQQGGSFLLRQNELFEGVSTNDKASPVSTTPNEEAAEQERKEAAAEEERQEATTAAIGPQQLATPPRPPTKITTFENLEKINLQEKITQDTVRNSIIELNGLLNENNYESEIQKIFIKALDSFRSYTNTKLMTDLKNADQKGLKILNEHIKYLQEDIKQHLSSILQFEIAKDNEITRMKEDLEIAKQQTITTAASISSTERQTNQSMQDLDAKVKDLTEKLKQAESQKQQEIDKRVKEAQEDFAKQQAKLQKEFDEFKQKFEEKSKDSPQLPFDIQRIFVDLDKTGKKDLQEVFMNIFAKDDRKYTEIIANYVYEKEDEVESKLDELISFLEDEKVKKSFIKHEKGPLFHDSTFLQDVYVWHLHKLTKDTLSNILKKKEYKISPEAKTSVVKRKEYEEKKKIVDEMKKTFQEAEKIYNEATKLKEEAEKITTPPNTELNTLFSDAKTKYDEVNTLLQPKKPIEEIHSEIQTINTKIGEITQKSQELKSKAEDIIKSNQQKQQQQQQPVTSQLSTKEKLINEIIQIIHPNSTELTQIFIKTMLKEKDEFFINVFHTVAKSKMIDFSSLQTQIEDKNKYNKLFNPILAKIEDIQKIWGSDKEKPSFLFTIYKFLYDWKNDGSKSKRSVTQYKNLIEKIYNEIQGKNKEDIQKIFESVSHKGEKIGLVQIVDGIQEVINKPFSSLQSFEIKQFIVTDFLKQIEEQKPKLFSFKMFFTFLLEYQLQINEQQGSTEESDNLISKLNFIYNTILDNSDLEEDQSKEKIKAQIKSKIEYIIFRDSDTTSLYNPRTGSLTPSTSAVLPWAMMRGKGGGSRKVKKHIKKTRKRKPTNGVRGRVHTSRKVRSKQTN